MLILLDGFSSSSWVEIDENEFRTIWAMTHESPLIEKDMTASFFALTLNRTVPLTATLLETSSVDDVFRKLRSYFEKLPQNQHEVHDTDEACSFPLFLVSL